MESTTGTPPTVAGGLEEVAQWRAGAQTKQQTELAEVDKEVESLQQAVNNLQQQLQALARFREELLQKAGLIDQEETQRSYEAIFGALTQQSALLTERAQLVGEAEAARQAAMSDLLKQNDDIAALLSEYEQFKSKVEPTLAALPDSYRSVIEAHHATVVARLREHIGVAGSGPAELEAEGLDVDVVYAIDAPDGQAELLMLVLPVQDVVHTGWLQREDDLQLRLAARVVQGLYTACHAQGMAGVQAMAGGHQGLLALEMELPEGISRDAMAHSLAESFASTTEGVAELEAARVNVRVVPVSVDHLLPPEDAHAEVTSD